MHLFDLQILDGQGRRKASYLVEAPTLRWEDALAVLHRHHPEHEGQRVSAGSINRATYDACYSNQPILR